MVKKTADRKVNHEVDYLFVRICSHLEELHGEIDENRLRQAYELALTAHEGQTRMDGSPYIYHPLEVAEICVDLNLGEDAIIAAILHDTVEDTKVRLSQIRQLFGAEVSQMVEKLTKIKKIDLFARFTGRNKASNQARNLQRLFISMISDTRVILIKLADRLHNMQTMGPMPEHKRQRISRETLEFYIPIARRLGMGQIVGQMEDLVFQVLQPEEFKQIQSSVAQYYDDHEAVARRIIEDIRKPLLEAGMKIERIYGRRKHLYSIHQKMQKQGVGLEGIYDLLAIRIIIAGEPLDCYRALGLIHKRYQPIFHRFRDFIASPKENGYQTLHTTVLADQGTKIECQIRTTEMDLEASKGVASHWSYKETKEQHLLKDAAWEEFVTELTAEQMESDEFIAKARDTLLQDQVLVLSPMGEVVNLPAGSTALDFAYYIHTELGHTAKEARINGHTAPLKQVLNHGDVVEIVKHESRDAAPNPDWLLIARSPKSILKIRRYFRALPREQRVGVGRNLLRQHIVKEGLYPLNLMANDKLAALLRQTPVRSIDDLYERVALGYFHVDEIVRHLKEIHKSRIKPLDPLAKTEKIEPGMPYMLVGLASKLGICMADGRPLRRRAELMRCCTPVPGDKIYGLWDRKERRVEVHHVDCPLLDEGLVDSELTALDWLDNRGMNHYPVRIRITSFNRVGLLFEVMRYLSSMNINLGGAEFSVSPTVVSPDRNAQFELVLEVTGIEELQACISGIARIGDVMDVERVGIDGQPETG